MNRSERRFRTEKTLKKRVKKIYIGQENMVNHGLIYTVKLKKVFIFNGLNILVEFVHVQYVKNLDTQKKIENGMGRLPSTWSGGTLPLVKTVK